MTRLIARLILAMLILPVTGALFVFLFVLLIVPAVPPSVFRILLLWSAVYLFVGFYWVLLWRSVVRWTRKRVVGTVLAMVLALVLATMLGAGLFVFSGGRDELIAFSVGGGVVPIVWVLATVLIWRETPSERIEQIWLAGREAVCCPICGYNLTGLTEARCPECGSKFTLDQLLAAQPQRDQVALPEE